MSSHSRQDINERPTGVTCRSVGERHRGLGDCPPPSYITEKSHPSVDDVIIITA